MVQVEVVYKVEVVERGVGDVDIVMGEPDDDEDAMDVDGDAPPATQPEKDKGPANPPTKKFRMNEQMKTIVWQLVLLSNEVCRLENEKK